MTAEALQFKNPHARRILRQIEALESNDPNQIPLSNMERGTIVRVVSRALEARKLDQVLRLAHLADLLNTRRGEPTTIEQRISSLFEAKAPGLEEEQKTKDHLPDIFTDIQSQVAEYLGEAVFRGDRYIALRYCGPITKNLSSTNATELKLNVL